MAPRLELQTLLVSLVPTNWKVYFQPPPNIQMSYPAIVYSRSDLDIKYASDNPYAHKWAYQVTVIDLSPDSPVLDKIKLLQLIKFNRAFVADNLNHSVFTLFF